MLTGASSRLKLILGLTSFLVYLLFSAAQLVAIDRLIEPYFREAGSTTRIVIVSLVVYFYIGFAGFKGVNKTDFFQFFTVVLLFVIPVGFIFLSKIEFHSPIPTSEAALFSDLPIDLALYLFLPMFWIPISQDVNIRIKAARSNQAGIIGLLSGGLFYFVIVALSISIGISLKTSGIDLDSPEEALPNFFLSEFGSYSILATIALICAIISTLDSFGFNASISLNLDVFSSKKESKADGSKRHISTVFAVFFLSLLIANYFNQILSLILMALLLYISLFIPIAVGRLIKVSDHWLEKTAIITLLLLIAVKLTKLTVPLEPVFFLIFHLILITMVFILQKISLRREIR